MQGDITKESSAKILKAASSPMRKKKEIVADAGVQPTTGRARSQSEQPGSTGARISIIPFLQTHAAPPHAARTPLPALTLLLPRSPLAFPAVFVADAREGKIGSIGGSGARFGRELSVIFCSV